VADDDAVILIARADKALYQAKSAGRNCQRVVTASSDAARSGAPALGAIIIPPVESSLLHR